MLEILAGGRISPIYKALVEKQKLATSFSSFEAPGVGSPNLAFFYGSVRAPHTPEELIRAFDTVLTKFKKNGVTQEQLEIAKRAMSMEYLTGLRSNMSLAKDLASSELIFGSWKASLDWYDKVLMVTREDVLRVAREYLVKERRTIGIVRKEGK
jgi:predicted Zn-dependent peptidase